MIKILTINTQNDLKDIKSQINMKIPFKYSLDIYYDTDEGETTTSHLRIIEDKPDIKVDWLNLVRNKGGAWLGTVRNWIKCKCKNGESVTWGSQDYLKMPSLTVIDLEYFAAQIAAAAINEYCNKGDL